MARYICTPSEKVLEKGIQIQHNNIRPKDSLNMACAIESKCQYFITTDINLLKKAGLFSEIKVVNPIDFIREMEGKNGTGN
jgi:predicted nucleic acid-binding protein